MAEFIKQFGIDWRLLISQAVNFLIVLIILRVFVFKSIARILRERKRKVEEGIAKSEEADQRLRDVQDMVQEKLRDAEKRAASLLGEVEVVAKEREAVLLEGSRKKGEALFMEAARSIEAERIKARSELEKEAKNLIRAALQRTIELHPEPFEEALLDKALRSVSAKHI